MVWVSQESAGAGDTTHCEELGQCAVREYLSTCVALLWGFEVSLRVMNAKGCVETGASH